MNENDKPIEAEVMQPTQAVALREAGGPAGILRPADTLDAIADAFKQYQAVCERILTPDDYQEYEGKKRKKKSAWRKLATAFNVSTRVVEKEISKDAAGNVISAFFTIEAQAGSRVQNGSGYCEVNEKCCATSRGEKCYKAGWKGHYCCPNGCNGRKHWTHANHDIISTAETRAKNRAISDLIGCGEVSAEELTDDAVHNQDNGPAVPRSKAGKPPPPSSATPPVKTSPAVSTGPKPKVPADAKACLAKFIENMDKADLRQKATQYLIDLAWLMPNEKLEDLPARFTPQTKDQYVSFLASITHYAATGKAGGKPFLPNEEPEPPKQQKPPIGGVVAPPLTNASTNTPVGKDPEWWRDVIVSVPRKGMKKVEYDKHPETIGDLFEQRHGTDDEAQAARQRLFGLVHNFNPQPREYKGRTYQPSSADLKLREALDAFAEYWDREHPGEDL